MNRASSSTTIGYTEFANWYDSFRSETLEPALEAASSALGALLAESLSDRDLARINSTSGRVKSKQRTWRKLRQPRYREQVRRIGDLSEAIDDLVGLRITCTNLGDIDMVQEALDGLPARRKKGYGLSLDRASERDYVQDPKDSGYRGWHVNLTIRFPGDGEAKTMTCELQVRTLLQDSWGELTHADTYSKDGELPPLVEVLSKRMADLISTLDDIAEDLRTELDRIDQAAVSEVTAAGSTSADDLGTTDGPAADAAAVLAERWKTIDRPTDLAALAWLIQRDFGAEVSDDWFGHSSFKRFLLHAVPHAEISTGRQAYLLPADYEPDTGGEVADSPEMGIPPQAQQLRRVDRGFPLLEAGEWDDLFRHLADAWHQLGRLSPDTGSLNRLTRLARDKAGDSEAAVSRRRLDYVAKALLATDDDGAPLDVGAMREKFATVTIQRMVDLRILGARNRKGRARVRQWLEGEAGAA